MNCDGGCSCDDCSAIGPSVAHLGGIMAVINPAQSPTQPLPADDPQRGTFDDLMSLASLLSIAINLLK